jgi:two-component system phosphate regulon sensor histidine kinase PhoR
MIQMPAMVKVLSKNSKELLYTELETRMDSIEPFLNRDLKADTNHLKTISAKTETRITITDEKGLVIFDSHSHYTSLRDQILKPEIAAALDGMTGKVHRMSETLYRDYLYTARPFRSEGEILGVIRLGIPAVNWQDIISYAMRQIILTNILTLLGTLLLTSFIIKAYTDWFREIEKATLAIASGNYNITMPSPMSYEMSRVNEAVSHMSKEIQNQKNKLIDQNTALHE